MKQPWYPAFALGLSLAATAPTAFAFSLGADDNWLADTNLAGIAADSIRGRGTNPIDFRWSDTDGDGLPGPNASAGLDLRGYNLYPTAGVNTPGLTLDLDNGSGPGAITNGGPGLAGDISTRPGSDYNQHAGQLTITNATHITVRNFDLRGESGGGASIVHTGNLTITGSVLDWHRGGGRTLLLDGQNAGSLTVSTGIVHVVGGDAETVIRNYTGVRVGGVAAYDKGPVADVGDYGINAGTSAQNATLGITITNIGSGGVTVPRGLSTYSPQIPLNRRITIGTTGSVACGEINTRATAWFTNKKAGDITITAGGSITVSNLNSSISFSPNVAADCYGGNIILTAGGDIRLTGYVNASNTYEIAKSGILSLCATEPASTITVKDLDCSQFITGTTNWTFKAGSGKSYITGVLANFDTTNSPCLELRVPAGQIVYYDPKVPGNEYLARKRYPLSGGGILRPPAAGAVVTLK